jgi:tetratricopeptide (TPR) repeat protein
VPPGHALLAARIGAREGTAHQALPDGGVQALLAAQDCYERSRADLAVHGLPEEAAELDLNLGLVAQALVGAHRGRIQDAIAHYHRALRVFTKQAWPREFAILHNNLAIAYLSIPATDERARMREALAVQSFEEVLQIVTLVDHPSEYAMTQNNLGNALQYAPSSHPVANLLRAIEAYDEALKVRTPREMPLAHANTVANKANALLNLPDDPAHPALGNPGNTAKARVLYRQALAIFERHAMADAAAAVAEALAGIAGAGAEFGSSRVAGAPAPHPSPSP